MPSAAFDLLQTGEVDALLRECLRAAPDPRL